MSEITNEQLYEAYRNATPEAQKAVRAFLTWFKKARAFDEISAHLHKELWPENPHPERSPVWATVGQVCDKITALKAIWDGKIRCANCDAELVPGDPVYITASGVSHQECPAESDFTEPKVTAEMREWFQSLPEFVASGAFLEKRCCPCGQEIEYHDIYETDAFILEHYPHRKQEALDFALYQISLSWTGTPERLLPAPDHYEARRRAAE